MHTRLYIILAAAVFFLALAGGSKSQQFVGNPQNFAASAVSCLTTPTLVVPARARNAVTVTVPAGGAVVYIGGPAVTTSTGFDLNPLTALTINSSAAVYCIAGSTQTLKVAETY